MKMGIFMTAFLMSISAGGSAEVLPPAEIPSCNETVEKGVWWPDVECAKSSFRMEDARLNRVWRKLLPKVSPNVRERLILEQRRWIVRRDGLCNQEIDRESEDIFVKYRVISCKYNLTKSRISYLIALM